MSSDNRNSPQPAPRLALWLSALLPLLALARLGQDGNWDLQNYHLYDVHAWLHGRLESDIAPAQLQTWHNPLLDVPLYWMQASGVHGAVIGVWLTLPMMVGLYLLLRLPEQLGARLSSAGMVALAAIAVSGVAAFSALGSSFNDAYVAAGVLLSLSVMFSAEDSPPSLRRVLGAGVIAGMTAGLKLTAATYCLGLAAAVFLLGPTSGAPRRLLALLVGGLLGLAITYGYWGALQLRLHGNPFFPYFNQVFHSPDALPLAYADLRFRPATLLEALLVPWRMLFDNQRFAEATIRDPRLLLGAIGFLILAARTELPAIPLADSFRARRRALTAFFFVSLLAWAMQYGIYRYALPLELLGCLALVLAAQRLGGRFAPLLLLGIVITVAASTNHANWKRSQFQRPMIGIRLPSLPAGSLVVTGSLLPVSFVATALPDNVPVVSFFNSFMRPDRCTRMQRQVEQRIASHSGPIWLLRGDDPSADEGQRLAETFYGLKVAGDCLPASTSLGNFDLCPMRRQSRPPTCLAPSAAQGP